MTTLTLPMLAAATLPAAGGPIAAGGSSATSSSLAGMMLGLIAVVLLILALGWVLRRLPGSGQRALGQLKVVASLPLGARERVVVVQVGGEQLVIGATGQHISLLKTLDAPLPESSAQGDGFAAILARRLAGRPQ